MDKDSINSLTIDTCTTMKSTYGIELYTIAGGITDKDSDDLPRVAPKNLRIVQ